MDEFKKSIEIKTQHNFFITKDFKFKMKNSVSPFEFSLYVNKDRETNKFNSL